MSPGSEPTLAKPEGNLELTMIDRTCPVCGSDDESICFSEANVDLHALDRYAFASRKQPERMHWRLLSCRRCDLLYASPIPAADDLSALYREAAFDSREEAFHASRTYGQLLAQVIGRLPDRAGALDIGTGEGAFLRELLAKGFSAVTGIEPSSAPIEVAAPEIRPLIRHDVFRPGSFLPESLTLITCFQTIEHLSDPLGMCREAWRTLKPQGALFLIGHNRRSFSAKVLGRKSPIFDIEHLQLFSPESFQNLLHRAGFSEVSVRPFWNRYPVRYWTRLLPIPSPLRQALNPLMKTRLGSILIPLPAGNLAAVGFK